MIIMKMIPFFEALHNEGRDASLSSDISEERNEGDGYERLLSSLPAHMTCGGSN